MHIGFMPESEVHCMESDYVLLPIEVEEHKCQSSTHKTARESPCSAIQSHSIDTLQNKNTVDVEDNGFNISLQEFQT